ncbi:MAG: Asp-tRNA(Asn)/Glu-tRNA(Gln) amidotransferase subunit GatC [Proteobacteria bacterium]|nr:Asp-tRNA(Asn)/Glu-tRNA(Gln) amidotransferase subunit GatC [Pseudomonadota bacterium]MBI3499667.1 Asp-tRNA(Asn)/Glu-tRNA(Gln) amidotransferase subunit GatC [Pseudomonadota bacterium]
MPLDKATVRNVATLARIRVADAELEHLAGELDHVLKWIEQLNEVDVSGVEPMTSVVAMKPTLRQDAVADGGKPEQILANAPEATQGFFVVPKVLE